MVICDVDKWSYFKVVGIIKDLGYKEAEIILYKDPIFGMFTLSDDKGDQIVVDLCKVNLSVYMYIQHSFSKPEYYDGLLKEKNHKPRGYCYSL